MRISLETGKLPYTWYNVIPDLPIDLPGPKTSTGHPATRDDLAKFATKAIVDQELNDRDRDIGIPKPIRELYLEYRPTPLFRAERWEERLQTPARIFFKYEGASSTGNYEANTAIPQAYFAYREGVTKLVTATSTGEMGISLAVACNYFGLQCKIYMVRSAYNEKVQGRYLMEMLGAEVIPSPSNEHDAGREALAQDPNHAGNLSLALSEAFYEAFNHEEVKFCWGTVANHCALHQSIIGLEARLQMKQAKASPDIIMGTIGGGSAFGGLVLPFYRESKKKTRYIAVETASAPSLSKGVYDYDYTDAAGASSLMKMYTLGRSFNPPGIRADGIRYHGVSPIVSALYYQDEIEAITCTQNDAFGAAVDFARAEGIIPSPESAYAIRAVMDEALACKQSGERKNILFLVTGNGNLDTAVFNDFLQGVIEDQTFPGLSA